jgi:hypothetical protein
MPSRIVSAVAAALLVPGAIVAVTVATALPAAAAICSSRTADDINHDGNPDVIVGEPFRKLAGFDQVGSAALVRGRSTGLTTTGNQQLRDTDVSGVSDEPGNLTGTASAIGFFDGDCFADAIVGVPGDGDGSLLYYKGSSTGLTSPIEIKAAQLHHNARDVGSALAVGDFNHDGYDDVAIGADQSDKGGGVAILYGSSTGLNVVSPAWFDQSSPALPGSPETGDEFGHSVAVGDFNGDHFADLAIGVPGEGIGSAAVAGDVTILYGTSIGLSTNHSTLWDENSTGIPGTAELQDQFGFSVAAGDVTGDGRADLVVGVPNEGIGSVVRAGEIVLLKGSSSGISGSGSQAFDQNSTSVPGASEEDDLFGKAVAVGDFNGDGKADVAVGVPGEGVGTADHAGCVDVLKGTSTGLTGSGSTAWDESTTGGTVVTGDQYGTSVLARKVTGGTRADLVIGTPAEDTGTLTDNGTVTVLLSNSGGLTATGSETMSAASLAGGASTGAEFGASLG